MNLWRWWMIYLATIPAQVRASNRWLDPAWNPRRRQRIAKGWTVSNSISWTWSDTGSEMDASAVTWRVTV